MAPTKKSRTVPNSKIMQENDLLADSRYNVTITDVQPSARRDHQGFAELCVDLRERDFGDVPGAKLQLDQRLQTLFIKRLNDNMRVP